MSVHFGLAAVIARPPQQVLERYHSTDSLPGVKKHVEGPSETTQSSSTPHSAPSPKQNQMMLEQVTKQEVVHHKTKKASQSSDDGSSQGNRELADTTPPWMKGPSPFEATQMLQEIIKQDSARRSLKEAIESNDVEKLRGSIEHGENIGLSAEELHPGKSVLERIMGQDTARCNLKKATESSDIEKLGGSIKHGERTGLLAEELDPAKSALKQIIRHESDQLNLKEEQQNEDQSALQAAIASRDLQRQPMSCQDMTHVQAAKSDSGCAATQAPWDPEVAARNRSRSPGVLSDRSGNALQEALLTNETKQLHSAVQAAGTAGGDVGSKVCDLEAAWQSPAPGKQKSSSYSSRSERWSNQILLALVILIAVVMPAVIWSLLAEKYTRAARLHAVLSDHTALLRSYSRRLDAEHSHRVQVIAAANQRIDMLPSHWAVTVAAFNESLAVEHSDRALAFVAVNQSLAEAELLVEREGSDRKDAIARANQSVDTEHTESRKALEKSFRALAAESSNRTEAVAAVTELVDQPQDDAQITQRLDTEISDRRTSVSAFNQQIDKESSERKGLIATLGQRMNTVKRKIRSGICTYCVTCGGEWPVSAGFVTHHVKDASRYGKKCHSESPNTVREHKINFCCAKVNEKR